MTSPKRLLRGIIHCHSQYSYDSIIPVSAYIHFARKYSLDFVVLTDHDTTAGSRRLCEMAAREMPGLEVPIAAEYKTDAGDVIAVFLREEIAERNYEQFLCCARAQDALLLLPHPYIAHKNPERVAADCDLVEVFNSRANQDANKKASELAVAKNKRVYAGSDAHLCRSLARVLIEFEDCGGLRKSLMTSPMSWKIQETPRWETAASQLIKGWKKRNVRLAANTFRSGIRFLRKRLANEV